MTFTKSQAKTLLTKDELALFDSASGPRLKKLTVVELKDLVARSRSVRDKSRGQETRQRRASQAGVGYRQTDDNARSEQKSQLLQEIHGVFTQQLAAVQAGEIPAVPGTKAKVIARPKRQVINRVQRAVVRDKIAKVQEELLVEQRMSRKRNTASVAAAKKATDKKAATKKTREKAEAKRTGGGPRSEKQPALPAKSSKAPVRHPNSEGLSRTQAAANRTLGAKASKTRVNVGGATRIKSHVASANRRKQSRRDSR
ncbi:MAG: hypothetical protein Q8M16_19870 [Pirellulaceae bacterium]|nr:hypothetical protein [Pirellulaceae bacterium]